MGGDCVVVWGSLPDVCVIEAVTPRDPSQRARSQPRFQSTITGATAALSPYVQLINLNVSRRCLYRPWRS